MKNREPGKSVNGYGYEYFRTVRILRPVVVRIVFFGYNVRSYSDLFKNPDLSFITK